MLTTASLASVFVALIGGLILWSNPARAINRAVFFSCVVITSWLTCLHIATTTPSDGLFWLRWTCAVGAVIPLSFWTVRQSIVSSKSWYDLSSLGRQWGWVVVTAALCSLPFTELFIPSHSS